MDKYANKLLEKNTSTRKIIDNIKKSSDILDESEIILKSKLTDKQKELDQLRNDLINITTVFNSIVNK